MRLPLLAVVALLAPCQAERRQPNILFIMADDLGWNDVSWNNKAMTTPTLERLAREGIRLDQAYSQQVCTPSRAAFLTGKYPFHIGRQKRALKPLQPTGLALNLTTMAEQLRGLGYATHMVGKWHLGYCAAEYTPTRRGFDTFLGFYLGSQNHFTHDRDYKSLPNDPPAFYDFREGEEVAKTNYEGVYSTQIFKRRTKDIIKSVADRRELNAYGNYQPFFTFLSFQATHAPLQARAEVMDLIPESGNPARDIYKAMVMDMDMAVAEIVATLKETGLYNDTLIVFTSDNGGAISHGASNWPLRGTKGTLFEGGTRAVTFVHAPHLTEKTGYVSNNLVHITDWMPTLLSAAGYSGSASSNLGLDGVDQWESLSRGEDGQRTEMVYNLKVGPMSGALRVGKHKIIFGKMYNKQGWYDTDNTALQCARMGKDKKAKRKNKTKMDRMGRKLGFKKSHKRKVQNKKLKGSKTKSKGSKKKAKAPKKNKKKGKERKKPGKEGAEKQSKKKRAREKKREKLKRERDRKKLQRLREKKKRQKKRLQKEEERKRKKVHKEALKKKKISKKKRLDQISRENSESSIEVKIRNPKKTTRREEKQDARDSVKKEKKLTKIWKDWLPLPSLEMQSLLRHRMADCNWEDFSDSGHSNTTHLIPRSDLLRGNIVEILSPMLLNPFDISAEDEASEFEEDDEREERMEARIERKFDSLDIAMYDVEADPEERTDLRDELPSVFADLRDRAIRHLANVVEADFPPADFSGHPRNFGGNFSPGWCRPKYL